MSGNGWMQYGSYGLPGRSFCLVRYVAEQITRPITMEIATRWIPEGTSPGSIKTVMETFPVGTLARREAWLETVNSYQSTAEAAVRSVESQFSNQPSN